MIRVQILCYIILSLFIMVSCGNDDEEKEENFFGTYNLIEFELSDCEDPSDNFLLNFRENGCSMYQGTEICNGDNDRSVSGTMVLSEDQLVVTFVVTISGSSFTESLDILIESYDESSITLCFVDGTGCDTTSYTINDGVFTISGLPDTEQSCLLSFSGERVN